MEVKLRKEVSRSAIWNRYLVWVSLIQTLTSLVFYGYVPLIPLIQSEFSLSKSEIGWMTSAVFFGSSFIAIPSGLIADRIGTRKTLFTFCLFLALVLFSFFFVQSFHVILLLLFLVGIGYGGITPGTNKTVMEKFTISNRGTAMGIKQTGVPLGSTFGTILLPVFANYYGWRNSLLAVSIFLFLLCLFHFKVFQESKAEANIENSKGIKEIKELLKNKRLLSLIAIIIFFIWIQLSTVTYLVLFINEELERSLVFSTFCLTLLLVGGVIGRLCWGFISDNFFFRRRGIVLTLIGGLSGLFMLGMGFINPAFFGWFILLLTLLLGITTQGWNGMFVLIISEVVKRHQVGLASGIGLTVVYIGAILGTPLSGMIIDLTGNYEVMWNIAGITILIVSIITYFIKLDPPSDS